VHGLNEHSPKMHTKRRARMIESEESDADSIDDDPPPRILKRCSFWKKNASQLHSETVVKIREQWLSDSPLYLQDGWKQVSD
jgi:hypothetical protein